MWVKSHAIKVCIFVSIVKVNNLFCENASSQQGSPSMLMMCHLTLETLCIQSELCESMELSFVKLLSVPGGC